MSIVKWLQLSDTFFTEETFNRTDPLYKIEGVETKVIRWLQIADAFIESKPNAVYKIDGNETKLVRWLQVPDVFIESKPSAVYEIEGTETKIVMWDICPKDKWTIKRLFNVKKYIISNIYERSHQNITVDYTITEGTTPYKYKFVLNGKDLMDFTSDPSFVINLSELKYGDNLITVFVEGYDEIVDSFTIIKEEPFRTSSKRTFKYYEKGYNNNSSAIKMDNNILSANNNYIKSPEKGKQNMSLTKTITKINKR